MGSAKELSEKSLETIGRYVRQNMVDHRIGWDGGLVGAHGRR